MDLIGVLQGEDSGHESLEASLKSRLQDEIAGMSVDNFLVRQKRRQVDRFQNPKNWDALNLDARTALSDDVADLLTSFKDELVASCIACSDVRATFLAGPDARPPIRFSSFVCRSLRDAVRTTVASKRG